MNIKEIGRRAIVPTVSGFIGAFAAVTLLKLSPTIQEKVIGLAKSEQQKEQVYDDIFKKHESIQRQFDSLFNDDFIGENDPFEEMKKMRKQMQERMDIFDTRNSSKSNPFDSWFSDKFGGGTISDISKREDENFVYYDIKVGDLNSASINTKIKNGYVSITGTQEKKVGVDGEDDNSSTQGSFKSMFSRTFPIPNNVDPKKMQMLTEKDKVILKFPKIKT